LLLGDLPWVERVELDSPYDVRDAGLARFSGKPVTGSNPGLCAPAEGGLALYAGAGLVRGQRCRADHALFGWADVTVPAVSLGPHHFPWAWVPAGSSRWHPLGSLPGLAARLCPVPWLPFSPARSRAPVACVAVAGPLGVARAGRGSPRVAPGL